MRPKHQSRASLRNRPNSLQLSVYVGFRDHTQMHDTKSSFYPVSFKCLANFNVFVRSKTNDSFSWTPIDSKFLLHETRHFKNLVKNYTLDYIFILSTVFIYPLNKNKLFDDPYTNKQISTILRLSGLGFFCMGSIIDQSLYFFHLETQQKQKFTLSLRLGGWFNNVTRDQKLLYRI